MQISRIGRVVVTFVAAIGATAVTGQATRPAAAGRGASTAAPAQEEMAAAHAALAAAARDLCGRQVVLLGENGFHGDGKTIAFKAALVQRLVDKCGFNAVFFESSHYDFIALVRALRSGDEVTPDMVSSAVGRLWNQSAEFAPLIPYLLGAARSGRVTLGGLDDQLGSRGAFYSLDRMPGDFAAHLAGARRPQCQESLRRRIWSDFPPDKPYSKADQLEMAKCLGEIRGAISASASRRREGREDLEMVASFERAIGRDFVDPALRNSARDRSLYQNFRWLSKSLPKPAKIIVWSANEHVAKQASSAPGFGSGPNLGFLVRQAYGARSFALGFSAASGSFRWSARETRPIPPAPAESLEERALSGSQPDVVYLGGGGLRALGAVPGAIFGHQYLVAPWSSVLDGVVILREELPPTPLDPPQAAAPPRT